MNCRIVHRTLYRYTEPVSISYHVLRLTPRSLPRQTCHCCQLAMMPSPAISNTRVDYFGNTVTFFAVQEPHQSLSVEAQSRVVVEPAPVPDPADTLAWEAAAELLKSSVHPGTLEACQFTFDSPQVRGNLQMAEYANASFPAGRPLLEGVLDLAGRIHRDFTYDTTATKVTTPVERFFAERRGVCQDFAHLQIACLRSLGLAARYVSGYLQTPSSPDREQLVGADASHAWVSIYCPGFGWFDVDPTNNLIPSTTHITLAWGRDYSDVSPIRGVIQGGGHHDLNVSVEVVPLEA